MTNADPSLPADNNQAHSAQLAGLESHSSDTAPLEREPVRLVIWDLDETFWRGTLSEGGIKEYSLRNHEIVVTLARRGVMSSICSRNDVGPVRNILRSNGIWDYFVFPSVNWTSKGRRVATIVREMQLRPASVLFIDDNGANRADVAAQVPGIQVAEPKALDGMLDHPLFSGKDDAALTRLRQYKLMEKRSLDRHAVGGDDEAFLRDSNIRIFVETDIAPHIDRAVELLNRTNQLNFTKRRLPRDAEKARVQLLKELSQHYVSSGLIRVVDNYGDYGYCGFYQLHGSLVVDFCFSCRILGMGVERWLYDRLGKPPFEVLGKVVADLDNTGPVDWITLVADETFATAGTVPTIPEIRLRGGCELDAVSHYFRLLAKNVRLETNHARGPLFVRNDCSALLLQLVNCDGADIEESIAELGYARDDLTSTFLSPAEQGTILILSPWADVHITKYRHKSKPILVSVDLMIYEDMTRIGDEEAKSRARAMKLDRTGAIQFERIVKAVRVNYEYASRLTVSEKMTIMRAIFDRIPHGARLFVVLPYELQRVEDGLVTRSHVVEYNSGIQNLAQGYQNVSVIPMNEVVANTNELFLDFDHFDRIVYYRLFKEIMLRASQSTP
jgi:FkbH-like protein